MKKEDEIKHLERMVDIRTVALESARKLEEERALSGSAFEGYRLLIRKRKKALKQAILDLEWAKKPS